MKELEQQHEEKMKIYRTRAREINEKCVIGDQRIKELQDRVRAGWDGRKRRAVPVTAALFDGLTLFGGLNCRFGMV